MFIIFFSGSFIIPSPRSWNIWERKEWLVLLAVNSLQLLFPVTKRMRQSISLTEIKTIRRNTNISTSAGLGVVGWPLTSVYFLKMYLRSTCRCGFPLLATRRTFLQLVFILHASLVFSMLGLGKMPSMGSSWFTPAISHANELSKPWYLIKGASHLPRTSYRTGSLPALRSEPFVFIYLAWFLCVWDEHRK